jgi:hypothetical protein
MGLRPRMDGTNLSKIQDVWYPTSNGEAAMKTRTRLVLPMPRRKSSPLERRRRTPLYAGAPEQPSVTFSKRESDLAKARINKWLELADTTLEKQDEAEEEAQGTRGKRKKSA